MSYLDDIDWIYFEESSYKYLPEYQSTNLWYTQYDTRFGIMKKDGKYGILLDNGEDDDEKNIIVFPPQWDSCVEMGTGYVLGDKLEFKETFTINAHYFIKVQLNGKYGVVDTAGRWITPCKWDDVDKFGETLLGSQWGFVNLLTKEEIPPQWSEPQIKRHPWEKLPYETANYFYSESPLGHGGGFETMVLFRADELSRSAVKVQIGKAELWMPDQTLL